MRKSPLTLLVFIALVAPTVHAEEVFYRGNTRIQLVDCERGQLQVGDAVYPVRLQHRSPDRVERLCSGLKAAARLNQSITLLTSPREPLGDTVVEEVVGLVDRDYMIGVTSLNFDPVFRDTCATTSRSTETCVWVSRYAKKVFVEMKTIGRTTALMPAQVTVDGEKNTTLASRAQQNEHRFVISADGATLQHQFNDRPMRGGFELTPPFNLNRDR